MSTIPLKRGDVGVLITDTLTSGTGTAAVPVNLTGATVLFLMKSRTTGTLFSRTATVVSAVAGTVSYTTVIADLATSATYSQEWQATFGSGQVLTFPDKGYNAIVVGDDLT